MHTRTHTHACTRTRAHMHILTRGMHTPTHTCTHAHIDKTCACTHTAHTRAPMHTYTCTHARVHTHACMHTHHTHGACDFCSLQVGIPVPSMGCLSAGQGPTLPQSTPLRTAPAPQGARLPPLTPSPVHSSNGSNHVPPKFMFMERNFKWKLGLSRCNSRREGTAWRDASAAKEREPCRPPRELAEGGAASASGGSTALLRVLLTSDVGPHTVRG